MSRSIGTCSSSNKRLRPVPCDYERTISDVTGLARKRAISLLDKCLNNHHLNPAEQRDIIIDVTRAFGLTVAGHEANLDDNSDGDQNPLLEKQRSSTRICSASKEVSAGKKEDDHNEVCEVCERGGDLLCCDTCSLVFHLACIRPKIASIPKGKWSCAHCVSDGVGSGDGAVAKKALINMGRLSRGLESEDETEDSTIVSKSSRVGEVMIIRSGKRFIVRKVAHSQIAELGRYDNLDDALGSIKPMYRKAPAAASSSSASDAPPAVGAAEEDDLWCTHCMDDPAVAVCAFCGCRTCFGKHNSEYLLLCDFCDQESHTYCLSPKLTEIPEEAWYCGSCIKLGLVKVETAVVPPIVEVKVKEEERNEETVPPVLLHDVLVHSTHRVKGRPGRPKKVATGMPDDYIPVARAMKVAGRGRGRPPGSGRSLEDGGPPKLSLKGQIQGHGPHRFKQEVRPASHGTLDPHTTSLQGYYPHSTYGTALIQGAGVKAILSIVDNNGGKRPFWPAEKVIISQMREWSPLEDLMAVHAALITQRDLLLQRIRGCDPMFVEPISAARSVRNAALQASASADNFSKGEGSASKAAVSAVLPLSNPSAEVSSTIAPKELISVDSVEMGVDVCADSSPVEGTPFEELESGENLMAVDVGGSFLDCEGDQEGVGEAGAEEEEEEEGDEDSKGYIGQEDEESKMEEEDAEDEEESDEGEEGNREDAEGDEAGGEDEEEEGSKEELEGDEEEEEEGTSSIDFHDAGMMKGEEDGDELEGEGDEQDGDGEEESHFEEESSEGGDADAES